METIHSEFRRRFARQISIPEIGIEGQIKLKESKVLIVGCGALGSTIAMQLAGAGVGTLGLIDFDIIDISNLQRQFFFTEEECGKSKVEKLAESVKSLNSVIKLNIYNRLLNKKEADNLFIDYDFIVDASDNPATKRIIDEISRKYNKPCCIGGVRNFEGQVITLLPGNARFEDIFGSADSDGFLPCSLGGVAGPAAALCASIQSAEVIKFITKAGIPLSGRLMTFNMLTNHYKVYSL